MPGFYIGQVVYVTQLAGPCVTVPVGPIESLTSRA
jgi:hypothetical protein